MLQSARIFTLVLVASVVASGQRTWGQALPANTGATNLSPSAMNWRPAGSGNTSNAVVPASGTSPIAPAATSPQLYRPAGAAPLAPPPGAASAPPVHHHSPIAKVTKGTGVLPNDGGQVWREYDISPYTLRVTSTNRPEQAIVDWILRETGYETWHTTPVGLLSADKNTLRVYHTPQVQQIVGDLVDRFVNSEAQSNAFGVRIVTMSSPNWRAKAQKMLHPISSQTQGVQAWLIAKEDAALLMSEVAKRTDFREHSSSHLLVNNGQSAPIVATRPHNYVKNVLLKPGWPGYDPEMGQIDEGYSLEFSPLLSLDGRTIDAMLKCNIDQVEKMLPVMIDVPTAAAPRQRTQIEVPQLSSIRVQERFHWPVDQVLLVSLGVVATPEPADSVLKLPIATAPPRADLLLLVDSKGVVTKSSLPAPAPGSATAPAATTAARADTQQYHGRY